MGRLLTAEWLKYKRSGLLSAVLLFPVAIVAVLTWYALRRGEEGAWLFGATLQGWTAVVLPFALGLTAAIATRLEGGGTWASLRLRPVRPGALYVSKLLVLAGQVSVATSLVAALTGVSARMLPGTPLAWSTVLLTTLCISGTTLPILAVQLWVAIAWGAGATVAVGAGGVLIAALVGATGLGEGIWPVVLWAWPVRVLSLAPRTACLLAIVALLLALFTTGITVAWFHRWEGTATHD